MALVVNATISVGAAHFAYLNYDNARNLPRKNTSDERVSKDTLLNIEGKAYAPQSA